MFVLSYIAGEGIFEQKLEREDINAHQVGVLDRKGCHTPLNKFSSCDYKTVRTYGYVITRSVQPVTRHDSEELKLLQKRGNWGQI